MKLEKPFSDKLNILAIKLWIPNIIVLLFFVIQTYFFTDIINKLGINPGVVPIGAVLSLFSVGWFIKVKRVGWAFFMNCLAIIFSTSTINPIYSLTIMNSASGSYTLRIMSIIALIFVPIVIAYQGWTYWIFRKRISGDPKNLHY